MTVLEAAKILGMSPITLRAGLQQGRFPFGEAILTKPASESKSGKDRWTYYINDERFEIYLHGTDMQK
jgi:hypothetical protein